MKEWKFKPGDRVSWETTGHGNNKRRGVIMQCLPSLQSLDGFPASQVDRYVVETPKLGKNGPVKSGKMVVMTPNRWNLEKNAMLLIEQ